MKKFRLLCMILVIVGAVPPSFAGPKEDFVNAVKKYCSKTGEDAAKLATPGRSGTVMKWKKCSSESIEIGGCNLPCKDASSSIGG